MKISLWRIIPFVLFLILVFFLMRGLSSDPHKLPSTKIGQDLPAFRLPLLHDETKQGTDASLRGKVYLLNIWASWCEACVDEQFFLMQLQKQGVLIFGINYKDDPKRAVHWLKTYGDPYYLIAEDKEGTLAIDLGVYGTPETFLIDKEGKIRYRHVGILNKAVWKKYFLPRIKKLDKSHAYVH